MLGSHFLSCYFLFHAAFPPGTRRLGGWIILGFLLCTFSYVREENEEQSLNRFLSLTLSPVTIQHLQLQASSWIFSIVLCISSRLINTSVVVTRLGFYMQFSSSVLPFEKCQVISALMLEPPHYFIVQNYPITLECILTWKSLESWLGKWHKTMLPLFTLESWIMVLLLHWDKRKRVKEQSLGRPGDVLHRFVKHRSAHMRSLININKGISLFEILSPVKPYLRGTCPLFEPEHKSFSCIFVIPVRETDTTIASLL